MEWLIGIALADMLKARNKVSAVFTGDGGTSEGDIHEALNVASVWSLPVLFCIENNGYGLSTPTSEQYNCEHLSDRGKGYGMESHIIEGNNIIEVYTKVKSLVEDMRKNPRPILLEFKTFRSQGPRRGQRNQICATAAIGRMGCKRPYREFC